MKFITSIATPTDSKSASTTPQLTNVFPPSLPRKEVTGNVLSLHDAEMQLINSGPAGIRRLAAARAFDMQELVPGISDRDARMIGAGYAMLRMQGMSGALTSTTRAEVGRLKAAQTIEHDVIPD